VGYAGGFGNVKALLDDVRSGSDSEEEFASARSEELDTAPEDITEVQTSSRSLNALLYFSRVRCNFQFGRRRSKS